MTDRFAYTSEITPAGEELERIELLINRLSDQMYQVPDVFTNGEDWPGDWTGRAILALACLEKLPGTSSDPQKNPTAQLDQILDALPEWMNEKGYIGEITAQHNEQQLAGHSWLLRGLVRWLQNTEEDEIAPCLQDVNRTTYLQETVHETQRPKTVQRVTIVQRVTNVQQVLIRVVRELFLPVREHLPQYQIHEGQTGAYSGNIADEDICWSYSTDTGCLFISLDGLSAFYEWALTAPAEAFVTEADQEKDKAEKTEKVESAQRVKSAFTGEIRSLLEELSARFLEEDVSGKRLQTHATLAALRGILRFAATLDKSTDENDRKKALILRKEAETVFRIYQEEGMSAAYGNYNWFRRPEWTEPCAIIDSFMLAMQFYAITQNSAYLTLARRVKSAMYHAQRYNGGFGCDSCAGAWQAQETTKTDNPEQLEKEYTEYEKDLYVKAYEAYWCCTMRGGEGLSSAVTYAWIYDPLPDCEMLTLPYQIEGMWEKYPNHQQKTATRKQIRRIRQIKENPGKTRFEIEGDEKTKVKLRLSIPAGVTNIRVTAAQETADLQYQQTDNWLELTITLKNSSASITVTAQCNPMTENSPGRYNAHNGKICLCADRILGTANDTDQVEPIDYSFHRKNDEELRYRVIH